MSTLKEPGVGEMRKRSVGTVERADNGRGRRSTIAVQDLNEADRALAQEFGYQPVSIAQRSLSIAPAVPKAPSEPYGP